MLTLHRAVAYMCQCAHTPQYQQQPEVQVFFEVPHGAPAGPHLQALLAHTWGCQAQDVEAYNIWSEHELLHNSVLPPAAGDARLLENGWSNGPLFCTPYRTLYLVRPLTHLRLIDAQARTRPLRAQQLAASGIAVVGQPLPARRHSDVARRAEFHAMQDMGGFC